LGALRPQATGIPVRLTRFGDFHPAVYVLGTKRSNLDFDGKGAIKTQTLKPAGVWIWVLGKKKKNKRGGRGVGGLVGWVFFSKPFIDLPGCNWMAPDFRTVAQMGGMDLSDIGRFLEVLSRPLIIPCNTRGGAFLGLHRPARQLGASCHGSVVCLVCRRAIRVIPSAIDLESDRSRLRGGMGDQRFHPLTCRVGQLG